MKSHEGADSGRGHPGRGGVPRPRDGESWTSSGDVPGTVPDHGAPPAAGQRQLSEILHSLAAPLTPSAETLAGVLTRARGARRRRRIVRNVVSTLAVAGLLAAGPSLSARLRHQAAPQAEPPAAVVDMATAYPLAEGPLMKDDAPDADRPVNALDWPARGAAVSARVLAAAQDYLLRHAKDSGTAATSATVEQLWAKDQGGGVFFVLQGWTVGTSDTDVAHAVLLAGEYAPGSPRIVMYEAPLRFSHPSPGDRPQPDDVADIAELSLWSPASNHLVVLGAPQVTQVLYAAHGSSLIKEATTDGVAVFARTLAKRSDYADGIQVRDAQNQALTPPGIWSSPDVVLDGTAAVYGASGWQAGGTGLGAGAGATAGQAAGSSGGPASAVPSDRATGAASGPVSGPAATGAPAASGAPASSAAAPAGSGTSTTVRGAGAVIRVAPSATAPAAAVVSIGVAPGNSLVDSLIIPLTDPLATPAPTPATGAPTR